MVSYQMDWDARLPIFILAYRAPTYNTVSLTPAILVYQRDLSA